MLASLQRKLMYAPAVSKQLHAGQLPEVAQVYPFVHDLWLTTADGIGLGGWYFRMEDVPPEAGARPLILFFHGNAGNRLGRVRWYQLFRDLGVDVLAIDYRGYGDSEGVPTEAGLCLDAQAVWKYATQDLGIRTDRIGIAGVSLGGAVAVQLASAQSQTGQAPAALIVVASFSSMMAAASVHYPWLPVRWILVDRYLSQHHIRHVTCPLLMFHGDQDEVVPCHLGRQLFAAAPEQSAGGITRRFVTMTGVGHRGLAEAGDAYYREWLPGFLSDAFAVRKSCPNSPAV